MILTYLQAIIVALAIGVSVYLLTHCIFKFYYALAVIMIWFASFLLALLNYTTLWLIVIFFVPILITSAIGTYFFGLTMKMSTSIKHYSAFLVLFPMHFLSAQVGRIVGQSWIEFNSTEETIYFLVLLVSPMLSSILVWGWLKINKSLPFRPK